MKPQTGVYAAPYPTKKVPLFRSTLYKTIEDETSASRKFSANTGIISYLFLDHIRIRGIVTYEILEMEEIGWAYFGEFDGNIVLVMANDFTGDIDRRIAETSRQPYGDRTAGSLNNILIEGHQTAANAEVRKLMNIIYFGSVNDQCCRKM